jgi:hypothetical protein
LRIRDQTFGSIYGDQYGAPPLMNGMQMALVLSTEKPTHVILSFAVSMSRLRIFAFLISVSKATSSGPLGVQEVRRLARGLQLGFQFLQLANRGQKRRLRRVRLRSHTHGLRLMRGLWRSLGTRCGLVRHLGTGVLIVRVHGRSLRVGRCSRTDEQGRECPG